MAPTVSPPYAVCVLTCPRCGKENPEQFRLCGFCGAPLRGAAAPAGEERKVVSVLFVDLVGFTASSNGSDPEDVRARLQPYHARVKEEIERFGGTVEKFVGDAVMAVFGAPVAHEDDAERAVRAALRIQEAIGELNTDRPGLDLSARAAVNTGEAVVSLAARPELGEGLVTGDVVNTASRLQQAAPEGAVVVGERTYRTTAQLIDYQELAPVTVKGKAQAIPIWLARGARSRHGTDIGEPPRTDFIGREGELALLQQTYARTVRETAAQLVTVTGEPGVGKSRLIREFFTFIDAQPDLVWWRQGRCLPYGEGVTFWALGEVVKAQAGILESDGPEEATRKLDESLDSLVEDPADRDWLRSRLAPLVGAGSAEATMSARRDESFTAWRRFLEAMAALGPLVLVLEDLHWADPALVEFVDHLVEWSSDVPILVICAARPELYERHPGWGAGKRNAATIALSPLTAEESARLIASLLSEAVLPAETQTVLLERAGGNPLYAEEFVRMLTDRGILTRRGASWTVAEGADIPVPETVQALIAGRLDTLPPHRKALLQEAAVLGKVFWSGGVASMRAADRQEVEEGLHELARKELVRPARTSSVKDQTEYSFWHALVRDVAYGQIPRHERARKHLAAAAWIELIAGERVTDHAELLSYHYGEAWDLASATGQSTEELEPQMARFLLMAGERAMGLDVARAVGYFRRALGFLPPGHPQRGEALARLSEAAYEAGGYGESERLIREAIEEFRGRGDLVSVGGAMAWLAFSASVVGGSERSKSLIADAVDLLEREPPSRELAFASVVMARSHAMAGRARESLAWAEKALALGDRFHEGRHAVRARQFQGFARCELGDLGGLDDLREAVRLSSELGLGVETVLGYLNLGDWVWYAEGPDHGLAVHRSGIELARHRGLVESAMWTTAETVWMLYDAGGWDELLRVAADVTDWARSHGAPQQRIMAETYQAQVMLRRGDREPAHALGEAFLPEARSVKDLQVLVPALVVAAVIEEARGDSKAAVALVQEFEDVSARDVVFRANMLTDATRVLVAAGAVDGAERLVPDEDRVPAARHRHAASTARAALTEARGDLEPAAALYEKSAEDWAEYGHALEQGLALLGSGRCRVNLGRPQEATGSLREARELFARLEATPLQQETDGWLERAIARTS